MPDDGKEERVLHDALRGRRVLVTGHTGFKGGWLCLWLKRLGAEVTGVALPPPPGPSLYRSLGLNTLIDDRIGDVRSPAAFTEAIVDVDAELIVHMAAQSLVRPAYDTPIDTYLTNVVGTSVVLDAARRMPSLRAAIIVTSDKCYDNREWLWGYREIDPMGGSDPYSSSKGCAELVVNAYRRSYFSHPDGPRLASVRAGNVIGGGDWSVDRIVPDVIRATIAGQPVDIRNPRSVRPWQHVLEPLHGYLMLATKLMSDNGEQFASAWNYGPGPDGEVEVETLAHAIQQAWGAGAADLRFGRMPAGKQEARILRLDTMKARTRLGWRPRLSLDAAVRLTVEWYRTFAERHADMRALSEEQIIHYAGGDEALPPQLPPFEHRSGETVPCA